MYHQYPVPYKYMFFAIMCMKIQPGYIIKKPDLGSENKINYCMEKPLWNKAWSAKYSTRKCYQQQPFNEHHSADFVKQTGKHKFPNDTAWFRGFNYYTITWAKELWKPIQIFFPKMKIIKRHLPSFVVLVDQIPVWGPPEAKNGGAGPTDPCLPTHRVICMNTLNGRAQYI